ncbi:MULTISPECIES: hypothetical protein [Mycolicibacterium]|uniref:DUF2933 domain-containing protein n=1 Tax=Mycolicibacterium pallens TaxID=370524 RepID=A0ABX8VIR9_9MYCO|nr:hypothetical protein [Mycolicibacterium pallens]QYL15439.1 hypothetical protein K0O64_20305 [Mycolicibacterium pallens]
MKVMQRTSLYIGVIVTAVIIAVILGAPASVALIALAVLVCPLMMFVMGEDTRTAPALKAARPTGVAILAVTCRQ